MLFSYILGADYQTSVVCSGTTDGNSIRQLSFSSNDIKACCCDLYSHVTLSWALWCPLWISLYELCFRSIKNVSSPMNSSDNPVLIVLWKRLNGSKQFPCSSLKSVTAVPHIGMHFLSPSGCTDVKCRRTSVRLITSLCECPPVVISQSSNNNRTLYFSEHLSL